MRTSLNEIKEIENYLSDNRNLPDKLLFDAKRLIDRGLEEKVKAQKTVYRLVKIYGRRQLRAELHEVHEELFQRPEHGDFKKLIWGIFNENK